jgi:hypothetical protein
VHRLPVEQLARMKSSANPPGWLGSEVNRSGRPGNPANIG